MALSMSGRLSALAGRATRAPRDGDRDRLAQPGVLDEAARCLERRQRLVGVGPVACELDAIAALEERAQQRAMLGGQLLPRCRDLEELLGRELRRADLVALLE